MDTDKRKELCYRFITGRGFEVGAGLLPSNFSTIDEVIFVDKRNIDELEKLFGARPSYQVMNPAEARARYPNGLDFVMAHQVLEHCSNPIEVLLTEWIPLVRDGGVLFYSIPSCNGSTEYRRIQTPLRHIVEDWLFDRGDADFESREHILSFIANWTAAAPKDFWYAADTTVQGFCAQALVEITRTYQDLHWHTYTLEVAQAITEIAFYAARAGMAWVHLEETESVLYLIARRDSKEPVRHHPCFDEHRERLSGALAKLG